MARRSKKYFGENLKAVSLLKQGLVTGETMETPGYVTSVKFPYKSINKTVKLEKLGSRVVTLSVFGVPVLWYDPETFSVTKLKIPSPEEYAEELARREVLRLQIEKLREELHAEADHINRRNDPPLAVINEPGVREEYARLSAVAGILRGKAFSLPTIKKINNPLKFIVFLMQGIGVDIKRSKKGYIITTSTGGKAYIQVGQFINFPEKMVEIPQGYIVPTSSPMGFENDIKKKHNETVDHIDNLWSF